MIPVLAASVVSLALFPLTGICAGEPFEEPYKNRAEIGYQHDYFRGKLSDWHLFRAEYERITSLGPLIARLNNVRRFERWAMQGEAEAYPKFNQKTYGYFLVSGATEEIVPRVKLAAELYRGIPYGLELSFGVRHNEYESSRVTTYTASVGWYVRSFYFLGRYYLSPHLDPWAKSWLLTARAYIGDTGHYVEARGGMGNSSDRNATTRESFALDALSVGGLAKLCLTKRLLAGLDFEFRREEIRTSVYRQQYTTQLMTGLLF